MKVIVKQNKINSVLSVIVAITDWSRHELDNVVRYGEPEIDIGGVFHTRPVDCECDKDDSNDGLRPGDFYIPSKYKKLRSEFPVMQEFDSRDYEDPEKCAIAWKTEIVDRIRKAVADLRQIDCHFVKEEIHEI